VNKSVKGANRLAREPQTQVAIPTGGKRKC
jgi:hypothetical protein